MDPDQPADQDLQCLQIKLSDILIKVHVICIFFRL